MRCQGGVDTQLNALDADRDLLQAQLDLRQTKLNELLSVVQLYKALGGGCQTWSLLSRCSRRGICAFSPNPPTMSTPVAISRRLCAPRCECLSLERRATHSVWF